MAKTAMETVQAARSESHIFFFQISLNCMEMALAVMIPQLLAE